MGCSRCGRRVPRRESSEADPIIVGVADGSAAVRVRSTVNWGPLLRGEVGWVAGSGVPRLLRRRVLIAV